MDHNPLLGTWQLKRYTVTTATGERLTPPYGDKPKGYLSYSSDGRMQASGVAPDRKKPASENPADHERLALYDSMFAYAGTYSVRDGQVIHHLDVSWNEVWTGTDQVRLFEVSENLLTLRTRIVDPVSGIETEYAVVWEKVPGAR